MNANTEAPDNRLDGLKLALAATIVVAAIVAFYHFSGQSLLVRVLGLLVAAGVAIAIALLTEQGKRVLGFFKEAHLEVRKVIWPTRKETVQTTLIVFGMVIIVALFLWFLDLILGWSVKALSGGLGG